MAASTLGLVLGLLVPRPARAQVDVIPQAGLWIPIDDLGRIEGPSGAVEIGRGESTLALGLGVQVGARGRLGLRADARYGTSTDVPIRGVDCEGCEARVSLLMVTAALAIRPLPSLLVARPVFLLGGGVKRRGFDDDDLREAGVEGIVDEEAEPALRLGAGLEVGLGLVDAEVHLEDLVTLSEAGDGAEESVQHDLLLIFGLRL